MSILLPELPDQAPLDEVVLFGFDNKTDSIFDSV